MKSSVKNNTNTGFTDEIFEEAADIHENIAESVMINSENSFEDDAVIEIDLNNSDERPAEKRHKKSNTIIDELEKIDSVKKPLSKKKKTTVNIEKLTIQIDGLTSVKKHKTPEKKEIRAGKDNLPEAKTELKEKPVEIPSRELKEEKSELKPVNDLSFDWTEPELPLIEVKEDKPEFKPEKDIFFDWTEPILDEVPEIVPEEKKPEISFFVDAEPKLTEKEKLIEEIINKKLDERIEKKTESIDPGLAEKIINILEKINTKYINIPVITKENELPDTKTENSSVNIPDKFDDLPSDFNVEDFGKINLKEAEKIAEEDITSFADKDLLDELKDLNILPDKKEAAIDKPAKEIEIKPEKKEEINQPSAAEDIIIKSEEKNISIPEISSKDKTTENLPDTQNTGESRYSEAFEEEIMDKNVFIIDNENSSAKNIDSLNTIDELEDISSSKKDTIEGKARQLMEVDKSERNAVSGLIRDNYPAFQDLLKDKKSEDKKNIYDDDIFFIDDLFQDTRETVKPEKNEQPEPPKDSYASPYEQMLGLIPDEFDHIEDQLFNIKSKPGIIKSLKDVESDTPEQKKFKYILPGPGSLMAGERKSIEDDISSESALIYEEDVDKIKKKLEDSMKKKIEETIQDITDKITIFEDSKNNNISADKSKDYDELKKMLKYLDNLMGKLPEDTIKNFADSEYYELYKKILKDMDI